MFSDKSIERIVLDCPFCGKKPQVALGKKNYCQLHGDPYQGVRVFCVENYCPAKPAIQAGDVYNGGEWKAMDEAIVLWNRRGTLKDDRK